MKKITDIKKTESGLIAVRWEGSKKYNIIEDPEVGLRLMFLLAIGKDEFNRRQMEVFK